MTVLDPRHNRVQIRRIVLERVAIRLAKRVPGQMLRDLNVELLETIGDDLAFQLETYALGERTDSVRGDCIVVYPSAWDHAKAELAAWLASRRSPASKRLGEKIGRRVRMERHSRTETHYRVYPMIREVTELDRLEMEVARCPDWIRHPFPFDSAADSMGEFGRTS